MLLKAENPGNITRGNSFSEDGHQGAQFDYMLSNPPFGVEWKKVRKVIEHEAESLGFAGRFGAGTPRINDGSFLFLQHIFFFRRGRRASSCEGASPFVFSRSSSAR
jgi:type I restriction enzyme M protein